MGRDVNKEVSEEKMSRINAAGIINIILENLWKDCYTAMADSNLVRWNRKLDAIWTNLGGDVEEEGAEDKAMNKIDENIYKTGSLNHKKTGFQKMNSDESTIMALQYLHLKKKSLFLRRLQNKQGKGTAYASDDDYDFD